MDAVRPSGKKASPFDDSGAVLAMILHSLSPMELAFGKSTT
jgi:hypothetical protein